MWKIIVGFIAFAALAMFVIMKGGDKLDMSGEKHGTEAHESKPAEPAAPAAPTTPASPAAPAASPAAAPGAATK